MTRKRILFTGGSGKAGKHVIPYLLGQGHRVMNVDLVRLDYPGVDSLIADITDFAFIIINFINIYLSYKAIKS